MSPPRIRPADQTAIAEAAQILQQGGLVAIPTETVYGLAADATNGRAVAAIFAAKGRPEFNPLIVHVASLEAARHLAELDERAERLAAVFWPGALTLVLRRLPGCPISELASAGLPTLAIRVPAHPVARALLDACRLPLAAPSANRSGQVSPTEAQHVAESLGENVDLILDAGPCQVGIESTIVGLTRAEATLLRPGGIEREAIEALIGPLVAPREQAIEAPGMLASHYAPRLPLRLYASEVAPDEALLGFGRELPEGAAMTMNLSPGGDLREAAAHLFAYLRALDRPVFRAIAVMPIPENGLGLAINDRLRRAAAGR
ncbi:MAG: threonylcarbamoyl-AMP synthase [Alphaproteobacteria bacterium]|nr:threonylcarbamoyl-AMP synthase [Alphaproteobacteria bacterium]